MSRQKQPLRPVVLVLAAVEKGWGCRYEQHKSITYEKIELIKPENHDRLLADLRERMGKIVVAYSKSGDEITTADLGVDGAMTAWMVNAVNPSLLQTIEGQPVLVGTISIENSETLSALLRKRGIKHVVLNAKYHEMEAEIVAQAGRPAAISPVDGSRSKHTRA